MRRRGGNWPSRSRKKGAIVAPNQGENAHLMHEMSERESKVVFFSVSEENMGP